MLKRLSGSFCYDVAMTNLNEQRFLDSDGRLNQWPSKQADQLLVLAYLAGKFSHGVIYSEAEINSILKEWHTFSDWPLLRRELFERGFIERNRDGADYHLKELPTRLPELVLVRPNVERDARQGVDWLAGEEGRRTLQLMGNTVKNNKPSTLAEEERRVRGFITSLIHETWMMLYEGNIIGAVWLDLEDTGYLAAPSVHIMIGNRNMRGKGVGYASLTALINQYEEQGHDEYLHSRHLLENAVMAKLFLRIGFKDDGGSYKDSDGLSWQNVRYRLQH
jgi:hypothetical protein